MDSIKILRIRYENIPLFHDGCFEFSLMAEDRVSDPTQVFQLRRNLYTQKLSALVGINASGKTSVLKLIYLAMSIVLERGSLNTLVYDKSLLQDETKITIDFCHGDSCYELHSIIGKRAPSRSMGTELYFKEEQLFKKPLASIKSKKDALYFNQTRLALQRSQLPKDALGFLKFDDSIVISIMTDRQLPAVRSLITFTNNNALMLYGQSASEVLHAFDSNLEMLSSSMIDNNISYTIKFKSDPRTFHVTSEWGLNNLISSGTIKGQNIMMLIEDVLQTGGYLIVDELENHMNKELVRMITDIFKNERINKHGACLIFSTHYAEILDFMDRKDNIYITRRNQTDTSIELLNYASEVKRNDVKKSDVILSNYIEGTAPSYESIQALEDYLCSKMD
ncbi:hypothetical protein BCS37_00335 [Selenomonas sp. oral taxon 920]|uniref:AAA family ATPase n=1 Tax=Selenomonas sp. oral taxon 920 TaxID=1884263 RepID=UPI000840B620|nr:ATP-binding protein [Selenomonas sp. oral taxon 920]AOH46989.1 hypothetical protein BCS37_00335 [Selenomonas sp. oral taxon 920]